MRLIPSKYVVVLDKTHPLKDVSVERRGNHWVVFEGGSVLNKHGEWEHEPLPSEREDNFIERTRFSMAEDAFNLFLWYYKRNAAEWWNRTSVAPAESSTK